MLKNTCCSICLSINKRTINIYDTELRNVYENLANCKISDDECWMCYICHTRLQQCHQLQQLAVQTRGLIDDIFQNKQDIKFGSFGCLIQLSTSKTKITDRTYNSSSIKQESESQMDFYDNGSKQDETVDNTNQYHVEVEGFPLSIEYEDPLVETTQPSSDAYHDQESKYLEVKIVKRSRSSNDEYALGEEEQGWGESSTDRVEVKLEIDKIGDKSMEQHYGQCDTNDSERREKASSQPECDKKPHRCDICFKNFKFKSDLLRHVSIHSNEKPFCCDICFRKFKSKECLNRHMRIHIGHLPYGCTLCVKKFLFESDLQRHIRTHISDEQRIERESLNIGKDGEPNVCSICSKKFSNRGSFNRHMRIHLNDRPYVCHICAKKFVEKCALDNHLLIHSGVKPFSCDVCAKKFALKLNLNRHKVVHTAKKPFSCDVCFKKFRFKVTLKAHRRTHGEAVRKPEAHKPFACGICTEKFTHERFLNAHIRIHTSDKIYSCDMCPKKFLRKTHLNRHKPSHTGDKPYSCDICSQKFTQKGSLKVHKRSHAGDRKFSCPICSKKFLRNYTLQMHIKIHETRNTAVPETQSQTAA